MSTAVGFVLAVVPIALVALTSARRAAVAIALTSPVVALGSVDLGFHLVPCYPLIAAGLAGVIARKEWRTLTVRRVDVALLSFGTLATVVTVANLGMNRGTTVIGATGANGVNVRPIAQLTALLAMIGLYIVIRVAVRGPDDLSAVLRAILVATLFVAAYAGYQVAGRQLGLPYTFVNERRGVSTLPVEGYVRPNSTLPEASPLAQFAFIALFLGVAWVSSRPAVGWPSRRSALFLVLAGFFLVFASLSKAAWVAGAICLPVVVWQLTAKRFHALAARRRWRSRRGGGSHSADRRLIRSSATDRFRAVRSCWLLDRRDQDGRAPPARSRCRELPFLLPRVRPAVGAVRISLSDCRCTQSLSGSRSGDRRSRACSFLHCFGLLGRGLWLAAATRGTPLHPVALALVGAYATGALMHVTYSYFYYPFEWVLAGLLGAIASNWDLLQAEHAFDVRSTPVGLGDSRTGGGGSIAPATDRRRAQSRGTP